MNSLKLENEILQLSNKILKQTLLEDDNCINNLNIYTNIIHSFLNKQKNYSTIENILIIKNKDYEGSYFKICLKKDYNIKKIDKYSYELKQCKKSKKWIIVNNKAFGIIELPNEEIYFTILDFRNIQNPDFITTILNNQERRNFLFFF